MKEQNYKYPGDGRRTDLEWMSFAMDAFGIVCELHPYPADTIWQYPKTRKWVFTITSEWIIETTGVFSKNHR